MSSDAMPPPIRSVQEIVRGEWRREWLMIGFMAALVLSAGLMVFATQRRQMVALPEQHDRVSTAIPGCPPSVVDDAGARAWLPAGVTLPVGSQIISAGTDQHGSVLIMCTQRPTLSIAQQ